MDHSLHNEAFDLCTEFQAIGIPHISASSPNHLQTEPSRKTHAEMLVSRLADRIAAAQDADLLEHPAYSAPDVEMLAIRAM